MTKPLLTSTLLLLMVVAQIGTDIYLASIPSISYALGSTTAIIQYTFSLFLFGFAFSQLFFGPWADAYGRRGAALFGLAIYSLSAFFCALTDSAAFLLAMRFMQGIGAGGCTVAGRAMMQDSFRGKDLDHINALQSMTWSLVPITAPLAGSYIQHYLGWRYNFAALSALAFCLFGFAFFTLRETHEKKEGGLNLSRIFHDYGHLLASVRFLLHLAACSAVISLLAIFNISAPVIIQKIFGLTPLFYGWTIFFVAMSFCIGTMIGKLCLRFTASTRVIHYGVIGLCAAAIVQCTPLLQVKLTIATFLAPIVLYQLFSAMIFPSLAANCMRPIKEKIGRASAIFGFTLFSMSAIASAVVSTFLAKGIIPFIILSCSCVFLLLLVHSILRRKYYE